MNPINHELQLLPPIVKYYMQQGFEMKLEVRIGYCRADLIAVKDNQVTAVELKLRDWKKAIIQAKNYQLGCDFVYLAVPLMKSYTILRKAELTLQKEGLGLLIVNEKTHKVCKIIEAKLSKKKFGTITLTKRKQWRRNNIYY